ncbi:hypothetical protein MANES_18G024833v8 [Manihot esculenta]|uniref:Uncharacterized protein n=2 Tax=Manihot esculenta TaxID=3983 RepID=A0ACB7G186_MANES|nr:hypothetical protein MANES_18G024833v8 [Manihot esculenta]KAG8632457.1 hypothetical protein MANES_18G024833v8 [Manihot esculenta]
MWKDQLGFSAPSTARASASPQRAIYSICSPTSLKFCREMEATTAIPFKAADVDEKCMRKEKKSWQWLLPRLRKDIFQ